MPRKKVDDVSLDNVSTVDFEKSLEQLTQLVERMEKGNLPLEESLNAFEQGVGLVRDCQKALAAAEQKVRILTQQSGNDVLSAFSADGENDV